MSYSCGNAFEEDNHGGSLHSSLPTGSRSAPLALLFCRKSFSHAADRTKNHLKRSDQRDRTMRNVSKLSVLLLGATMLCSAAFAAQAETVKLTFLGVGDVYNFDGGKTRGGLARMNAVAKAEKAANPNTIYAFDGDMLSPSLLSGLDKGQNMIDLTNMVPFDIAVPGNHEFDFGTDNFLAKLKESKYPWAAINITHADGSKIEGLGGVMMKEVAGLKIALIPVAQDTSPEVASTGDWKFEPSAESAVVAAKQARKDGADLVVGVVQTPHSQDQLMFASKAFDVLLSGDDHDIDRKSVV